MQNNYLFLFHTALGAVKLKKALSAKQIDYRVIDAPRSLTAQCGLSVKFALPDADNFSALINDQVSAVYQYQGETLALRWRDNS